MAEVDEAVKGKNDPTGGRGLKGHISERLGASEKEEEQIVEAVV